MRRLVLILILVTCALVGAVLGQRLAGPATYATDLGDIQLDVSLSAPDRRGLEVYVPLADWGLRAKVTGAPVRFTAEPRGIDRGGVADIVTSGAQIKPLRRELTSAFESAGWRTAWFMLAGALAGGLVAALMWHALGVRGRRMLLAPLGAAGVWVALAGGLTLWASQTWAPDRLERPSYYASGEELERILAKAAQLRRIGGRYADQVDTSIRAIAGLLDTGVPTAPDAEHRMLLASDIHNNVLPFPTLRRYAAGHPVVLAGDYTINGSRVESNVIRGLATLGKPTLAVAGNHDSTGLMKDMARRGVDVLTHEGRFRPDGSATPPSVQDVDGITVAGFEDPLRFRFPDYPRGIRTALSYRNLENGDERFRADVDDQWGWFQRLPERPDVLVLHQEDIARALANRIWDADPDGPPLTIMTGHTHYQALHRYGPVTVVNGGTAGAGGIFGTGRNALGLALLDFTPDGALEAVDLVQTDPTTTAARARRVIIASPDCDDELVFCHDEPDVDLSEG